MVITRFFRLLKPNFAGEKVSQTSHTYYGLVIDFENLYRDSSFQDFLKQKVGINEETGLQGLTFPKLLEEVIKIQKETMVKMGKEIKDLQKLKQFVKTDIEKTIINVVDEYIDTIAEEILRLLISISKQILNSAPIRILVLVGKRKVLIEKIRDRIIRKVKERKWKMFVFSEIVGKGKEEDDAAILLITGVLLSPKLFRSWIKEKIVIDKLSYDYEILLNRLLEAIEGGKFKVVVVTRDKAIMEFLKSYNNIIRVWRDEGYIKDGKLYYRLEAI